MRTAVTIVATSVLSSALTAFLITGPSHSANARGADATDLGPADALILAGSVPLKVTNTSGRLSWSADASSRAYSMATVHVGRVLGALMESDKIANERKELADAANAKREDFDKRYKELVEKARSAGRESPEAPQIREEFESFQKEFAEWSQNSEKDLREMVARHYESAYAEIREAVEVVAEARKIDLVMRFVPPTEKLRPGEDADLATQLQARAFLRSPEAIDITEDILSEMNITAPKKD